MTGGRIVGLALAVLATLCLPAAVAASGVVDLSLGADGKLFALLDDGRMVRVDPEVLRATPVGKATIPPAGAEAVSDEPESRFHPVALATHEGRGGGELYVTGFQKMTGSVYRVHVNAYGLDGAERWRQTAVTLGLFAGAVVDPVASVLYLSSTRTAEIYCMPLGDKRREPKSCLRPWGAVVLGPLDIDRGGERLFVADVARGQVLAVSLATGKGAAGETRTVAEGLGEPVALAWDAPRGRLWIADRLAGEIIAVDPDGDGAEPVATRTWKWRSWPGALAVTGSGDLWAGEAESRRLVLYPADGGEPRRFKF